MDKRCARQKAIQLPKQLLGTEFCNVVGYCCFADIYWVSAFQSATVFTADIA